MYLAYTAIHNALQVPGEAYPTGAGASGGMQWPLKATPQTRDQWIHPDYAGKASWDQHMKRYATMARRLDDGVADILKLLSDLHIQDNTIVIFTSDNGPANEGGGDPRYFDSWGPFDGFKRDCFEGGVREPTMVAWPGHIKPGRVDDTPSAFWDWMPTLAELAGLPAPAHSDGISLLPMLLGKDNPRKHDFLYIEYYVDSSNQPASKDVFARKHVTARNQQQLVRIGDFVGVRTDIQSASDPLRLYDVMTDPHEDHDLARESSHRELLKRMTDLLVTARRPEPSAKRPYDDVPLPAVNVASANEGHLNCSVFSGSFPYTPDFATMHADSVSTNAGLILPEAQSSGAFGVHFAGYLRIPADGKYTFTAASDSAIHLWLHDAHVIDSDHASVNHPLSATILLKAGLHPFRLSYLHGSSSAATLTLRYAGPNLEEQAIPASAFSIAH